MNIPRPTSGLSVLLGNIESSGRLVHVPIDQVVRNESQPRTFFDPDAIAALASSIEAQGLIQPIAVRQLPEGGFEIVAGERRWLAAQQAGLKTVPAVVHDVDDRTSLVFALAENLVRENLNPLEAARAYAALLDEFGMSVSDLARAVGKSRPAVSNTLRLLELPDDVLEAIEGGRLSEGHGRALLQLGSRAAQRRLARTAIEQQLSVRALEALARSADDDAAASALPLRRKWNAQPSPQLQAGVDRLADAIPGMRPRVKVGDRGGKLELQCGSEAELTALVERLAAALDATG